MTQMRIDIEGSDAIAAWFHARQKYVESRGDLIEPSPSAVFRFLLLEWYLAERYKLAVEARSET